MKIINSFALIFILLLNFSALPAPSSINIIELNRFNTLLLDVEIDAKSTDTFLAALAGKRLLLPEEKTLYIIIASGGGNYYYAKSIQSALRMKAFKNVSVICKYCASAAGFIFATHTGDRLAISKSQLLMHELYLAKFTAKNAYDETLLDNLVIDSDNFNRSMYTIIGMSQEEYENKIENKEWIVKGKDLVKLHLASRLITINCDDYVKIMAPNTCSDKDDN